MPVKWKRVVDKAAPWSAPKCTKSEHVAVGEDVTISFTAPGTKRRFISAKHYVEWCGRRCEQGRGVCDCVRLS